MKCIKREQTHANTDAFFNLNIFVIKCCYLLVWFLSLQHTADFEDLVREIVTMLDPEEQDRLREMEDWIIKNEGTWVLSEGFNVFLGKKLIGSKWSMAVEL